MADNGTGDITHNFNITMGNSNFVMEHFLYWEQMVMMMECRLNYIADMQCQKMQMKFMLINLLQWFREDAMIWLLKSWET